MLVARVSVEGKKGQWKGAKLVFLGKKNCFLWYSRDGHIIYLLKPRERNSQHRVNPSVNHGC